MNINVNLVILRHSKNLFQKDVAKALGITKQAYQSYEGHRAVPPLQVIEKIIKFYDIKNIYQFLFEII